MAINKMLDKIDNISYNNFVRPIFRLVNQIAHPDTLQEEVSNILDKLNTMLEVATPLISVQPVIITIGYLRCTFSVRHLLSQWPIFLAEAYSQLSLKFKPEKVNKLLRGLL